MAANEHSAPDLVTIKPRKGWLGIDLKELWHYRELIYFLTWRDIKVRYKQAILGIAWAILQPVLTTAITSLVFGVLLSVKSDGLPYPVFVLSALLPWHLFQLSLQKSSVSLVGNANLITKIYFPRIIIPISSVSAVLVDFLISLVLLFIAMAIYGIALSCPITTIPEGTLRYIYSLNPMVGVVQGFRWALFGGSPPDMTLLVSAGAVLLLLVGGLFYFKRMEKTFADVV